MSNRYLENIEKIVKEREGVFRTGSHIIPSPNGKLYPDGGYPLADGQWVKIPDVVCIFVDMRNSTGLSATTHDRSTASIYELFTETAVRIFHEFEAGYIDIKGDGVFALFNRDEVHRALASAVSFRAFVSVSFLPTVRDMLPATVDVGLHMGADQKTVLVKKLGIKDAEGRDSRKNDVWAGKPINMAAKLASQSADEEMLVSDRFYNNISKEEIAQRSCGCQIDGTPVPDGEVIVWKGEDVSDNGLFDFDTLYHLQTPGWCPNHGKDLCERMLQLDE